mgnify:CR=1 FL=1
MKKAKNLSKFSQNETLNKAQAHKIKGGDDKRPPLTLPGKDPGPQPNCNAIGFYNMD